MSIVPRSVVSETAIKSGIECVRWMSSTSNGPSSIVSPALTSVRSVSLSRCSSSFDRASAMVSGPPKTGMSVPSWRRIHGSEPRWSSWPWVMMMPSMSSARSRRYVKSGRTRSMPTCSAVGKRRPVSTTTIAPSYSTTVMFLPISPSPPSGRTRSLLLAMFSLGSPGGGEQPVALEDRADLGPLVLVGLDERQPQTADLVAGHLQRGLHRDWVGGDAHRGVDVAQRGVDLGSALGLVDHPAHLVADQVAGDADAAAAPDLERAQQDVVVAGVDAEAVDRRQVVVVGLLDVLDVVELCQLGQQVVGDVDDHARRDVVQDDRHVGGLGDLLVVPDDPTPVGLVVVRGDAQDGVDTERGGALGQVDGVPRVVGADARGDADAGGPLLDGQLDDAQVLLVAQRRRLAGGAADDEAVRPVGGEVLQEVDERLLVDVEVVVERRDDRGEDGTQPGHVAHCPMTSRQGDPRRSPWARPRGCGRRR